jgi:hypothetical protein
MKRRGVASWFSNSKNATPRSVIRVGGVLSPSGTEVDAIRRRQNVDKGVAVIELYGVECETAAPRGKERALPKRLD